MVCINCLEKEAKLGQLRIEADAWRDRHRQAVMRTAELELAIAKALAHIDIIDEKLRQTGATT